MIKIIRYILFLLFVKASPCFGQSKNISHEATLFLGDIIIHSPKLSYQKNNTIAQGYEYNLKWNTFGEKNWQARQKYPALGLGLLYYNFGDNATLGSAISILPNITYYVVNKEKYKAYLFFGKGLAYLTKKYDFNENPNNNFVGSHLNINAILRVGASYKITENWSIKSGFAFTHYSNGSAVLPNYGINTWGVFLGVKYKPTPLNISHYQEEEPWNPSKRWGMDFNINYSFDEVQVPNGPRYNIYIASLGGYYYVNRANRTLAGVEVEYNSGAYAFAKQIQQYETEHEYFWKAGIRIMPYVGYEMLFGKISLAYQIGIYANSPDRHLIPFPVAGKLSMRYYPLAPSSQRPQFYIQSNIKTHLFVADYIALGIGCSF